MSECSICLEKFNLSTRIQIFCDKCDNCFCRKCLETDIMTEREGKKEICECLHCSEKLDLEKILPMLPKNFYKKFIYPKELEKCKTQQIASLSEIADYAHYIKEHEKWKLKLQLLNNSIVNINTQQKIYPKDDPMYLTLEREKEEKITEKVELLENKPVKPEMVNKKQRTKCFSEGCRGFLNSEFKCFTCETQFCKECYKPLEEDHVCKEEDKEFVLFLKRNVKNCPKCSEPIEKIDGCNQMWCTKCHTVWDWESGREIEGLEPESIHNPEFLDWWKKTRGSNVRFDERACDIITVQDYLLTVKSLNKYKYIYEQLKVIGLIVQNLHMKLRFGIRWDDYMIKLKASYLNGETPDAFFHYMLEVYFKSTEAEKSYTPMTRTYMRMLKDILIDVEDISTDFNNHHSTEKLVKFLSYQIEKFYKVSHMLDDMASKKPLLERGTTYFYRGRNSFLESS